MYLTQDFVFLTTLSSICSFMHRMEKMLVGVTSDDLRLLNLNLIRNKLDLLRMNFSILQVMFTTFILIVS